MVYKKLNSSVLSTEVKERLNAGTHEPPNQQPADGKKTNGDDEDEDEDDLPFIDAQDVSGLINADMILAIEVVIINVACPYEIVTKSAI